MAGREEERKDTDGGARSGVRSRHPASTRAPPFTAAQEPLPVARVTEEGRPPADHTLAGHPHPSAFTAS